MKLYLVEADWCDYDQYDSFVVWAKSPEEALSLVRAKDDPTTMNNFDDNVKVTEIKKPKESGIVLGSFNAG
ncbi:TPA: hypothetical protein OHQ33_001985 [Escherichia coli]|nr:hypothetical protein [Escherichia coli]